MTDDDYAPWNALTSVFGNSPKHLLCTWHVLRAWSRRLRTVTTDQVVYREMFTALRTIMYAADEPTFLKMVEGFCAKYVLSSSSFVQYFTSNYLNRPEVVIRIQTLKPCI